MKVIMHIKPLNKEETIDSHFADFFAEIDVRLAMMVEDTSVVEHRARVFKMMALTTVEMMIKDGNCALLEFLITFIQKVIFTHQFPIEYLIASSGHFANIHPRESILPVSSVIS